MLCDPVVCAAANFRIQWRDVTLYSLSGHLKLVIFSPYLPYSDSNMLIIPILDLRMLLRIVMIKERKIF